MSSNTRQVFFYGQTLMEYIIMCEWDKYQHYKRRNPPWIKVHVEMLKNRHFMSLADASVGLLLKLWVLASENDGKIDFNENDVCFRLRRDTLTHEVLQPLIDKGFIKISNGTINSGCKQSIAAAPKLAPETETEDRESDKPPLRGGVYSVSTETEDKTETEDIESRRAEKKKRWPFYGKVNCCWTCGKPEIRGNSSRHHVYYCGEAYCTRNATDEEQPNRKDFEGDRLKFKLTSAGE